MSIDTFKKMLEKGPDSALLRFSLGNAYVAETNHADAIIHLTKATELDEKYSAAWKLLGRCYLETGDYDSAIKTYERGISIAEENGDKQAAKEMSVFLKRATKKRHG